MTDGVVLLDSDTLSEISRGHAVAVARARDYLAAHGRLTLSAITVFERLRGYRAALREGKPFQLQLHRFELLAAASVVLPVDGGVAERAAVIWAGLGARARRALGDVLIAATAVAHGLPLATRNRRDFEPIALLPGVALELVDWCRR